MESNEPRYGEFELPTIDYSDTRNDENIVMFKNEIYWGDKSSEDLEKCTAAVVHNVSSKIPYIYAMCDTYEEAIALSEELNQELGYVEWNYQPLTVRNSLHGKDVDESIFYPIRIQIGSIVIRQIISFDCLEDPEGREYHKYPRDGYEYLEHIWRNQ